MSEIADFTNSILDGDCGELVKKIPDSTIDLIIADPPYLLGEADWDKREVFDESLVEEFKRILKPSGSIYVWCGIGERSQSLIRWFPFLSKHLIFKDMITWKKQRGIGMRKGWLYTREEILWFVKDNSQFIWNKDYQCGTERRLRDGGSDEISESQNGYKAKSLFKRLTNVWTDISEESFNVHRNRKHTTPKPFKAIDRIIQVHTNPGDVVLDPFCGSGVTPRVAKMLNRKYIGIDLDPSYCRLIRDELEFILPQNEELK